MTRAEAQRTLADRLGSATEARWMVDHVVGAGPSGAPVGDAGWATLDSLADRRLTGEPLQYVLGRWAFRHLDLRVDRRALIPRPETEQVVEVALAELRRLAARRQLVGRSATGAGGPDGGTSDGGTSEWEGPVVVDLGTGTGAIALSVATETDARVWAADADPDALALAASNLDEVAADRPDVAGRVSLVAGRWFDALPCELRGHVDLVVSNPPYVAAGEWDGLDPEVRREPRQALVAADGTDGTPGLADVEAVLRGSVGWLARPGAVVVELDPRQAAPAAAMAEAVGFGDVRIERDLAGRDRAVVGRV